MLSISSSPAALSGRPPLPTRPQPHERDGRQPQPGGGQPHPRIAHDDSVARELLTALYDDYAPLVLRTAARALRPDDRDLVDDLAQDVWLDTWRHLLRGNELRRPAGWLATRTRRRAIDHYRLAHVRRERATDYSDDVTLHRIARMIGDAA
ncbi:sigma-70 family RNA polymerase sigma factor [Streptomyces sp. NPDC032940]|uniref:RNA polymerase sigma factor n=1 Tax=Streptomyces sp. NPDC032940 TaxID=3155366 RepID=UPI0033ED1420